MTDDIEPHLPLLSTRVSKTSYVKLTISTRRTLRRKIFKMVVEVVYIKCTPFFYYLKSTLNRIT